MTVIYGQSDSIYIEEIIIETKPLRQISIGSRVQNLKKNRLGIPQHLNEILQYKSNIYIKSYGLGSLATTSIRGGSAAHTLILWNGIPIGNPMLGMMDLSLVPTDALSSLTLTKGGNGAIWGSGAIGGIIDMRNSTQFRPRINFTNNTTLGSFGRFHQSNQLAFGNKKFQSQTSWEYKKAQNNFAFTRLNGEETEQSNAELNQLNISQDFYWKPNNYSQLEGHYFYQKSNRQIPPTATQNISLANQEDITNRMSLSYQWMKLRHKWSGKLALIDEHLNYEDPAILLVSNSKFRKYYGELSYQYFSAKQKVIFGIAHTFTKANSQGYRINLTDENLTALFGSYYFYHQDWKFQFSLREELVDDNVIPIIPSLGIEYQINQNITLMAKFSRNYRLPTLNDRYWYPGGNRDLRPEQGWSQEVTLNYKVEWTYHKLEAICTGFNRNIEDWIMWAPLDQSFWSASNIGRVWSRGVEPEVSYNMNYKNLRIHSSLSYTYVKSTNQVALSLPKIEKGSQLIYTPKHLMNFTTELKWKEFATHFHTSYVGSATGINEEIESYWVSDLTISRTFEYKTHTGKFYILLNNIFNHDYRIIERRPMPGRNYQLGIHFNFNKT